MGDIPESLTARIFLTSLSEVGRASGVRLQLFPPRGTAEAQGQPG